MSVATAYGCKTEEAAREAYIKIASSIKPGLKVWAMGLCVSVSHPWLAGRPDGAVTDPTEEKQGLLEIKCPATAVNRTLAKCA